MDAKIFRVNYKSDFILTLTSDAGWMTPFCIKFWTGAPSQAYYAQWDGETYAHCVYDPSEPTKLTVQFDDHHLPIGELKYQVAYHFTVDDFPNDTEDEVLNPGTITTEIDGETYQVMLDLTGETAPEIHFSLPAYANEAQRIANEQQRIENEQTRIANEEQRIAAEQTRLQNEATRIAQEEARVTEFARLKRESEAATGAANDAAALANQKAQLAADKAALAQAAATLAGEKAQLADDKAALADAAATLANAKAALAQQKATYAQTQGDYAKEQGDYAKAQGDYAKAQGDTAQADHERAEADHTRAEQDHTTAANDHTQAASDHTTAASDHTRAESDHTTAASDHTTATNDHAQAVTDHTTAAADHTQADNDHTRAESDHTRAESDHAAVEVYVDSLGAFDISAYHATGGVLAKYADLTAALDSNNGGGVPQSLQKGGMSVKFVQRSNNKYVQFRYMGTEVTGTPNPFLDTANWQGVDDEPTAGSDNLVKSGGVYDELNNIREEVIIIPDEVWNDSTGYSMTGYTGRSRTDKLLYNEYKGINMAAEALFWDENNIYLGYANVNGGYCISPYANAKYIAFSWNTIVENFQYSYLSYEKQEINAIKQNLSVFCPIVENQTVNDNTGQIVSSSGSSRTAMLHYIDEADINDSSFNACYYAKDGTYLGHTLDSISPYPNTEFIIFCWDGNRRKIASNIIYSTNVKKVQLDAIKAFVSSVEILKNMAWDDSRGVLMSYNGWSSTKKLPYNKECIISTDTFECLFFSGDSYQGYSLTSCVSPYQDTTHIAFTWRNTIQTFALYSYLADVNNFKTINGQSILGGGDIAIPMEEQIQSNWTETNNNSKAFIQNKPDLNQKQDTLQSGVNIKTINGQSILGSGNMSLSPTEPTAVKTFYNAADFGFLPTASASENVAALNLALSGGNRTVVVSEVGIYDINDTILIESNTELIFGKGVILRKVAVSGTYSFITTIRNKHAESRTTDSNIIIRGLELNGSYLPIDKSTMNFGSALYGCTGDIVLYHVDRVILDDIKIYNVPNYGIQLCSFNNVTITNFDLSTGSDGIHVNRGANLLCKGGVISSHDDAMALNASDWLNSCPEVGDICNVVFEDIIDKSRASQTGYATRHLTGAWVDWFSGMKVIKGDKVVSNGHVYRCNGSSENMIPIEMTSTTQPTFDAATGDAVLDGIHWRYCQDDAVYQANIDNVVYRNIVSYSNRYFCSIEVYLFTYLDRSIYPTVDVADYPHCKGIVFENIDKQGTGYFVKGTTSDGDIIRNVVLDYTLKGIKCSNLSLFSSLAQTHDSFVKIIDCDFTRCSDTYYVRVGDITTLYLNDCIYNDSIPVKEGGIIKTNCNLSSLPTSINGCKGSVCFYQNDIYYCNGSAFVKLT